MATVKRHVAAIISELDQNMRTVSVSESHSTPSRHTWPKPMHNLTVSFSWKVLEWSRVLLPWVAARTQMQFAISCSSPRVRSCPTKVVTVDAMDIMGWERMGKSMYVAWR